MFIIHAVSFLILLLYIAHRFHLQIVEAAPVGGSLLILFLYVLSFFGGLRWIDPIAVLFLTAAVFYLFKISREKRSGLLSFARREFLSGGTLTALAMTLVVTLCVSSKVVSWWDDYNFWATDVKSLFYLNGFAGKYANVAPEFGDYPPGTQMMKWWFLHFSPDEFREGLMFAGYYFMNLLFLFPMLKVVRKRNPFFMAAGALTLWCFPAVTEVFWCDGCCADLTMAVVYGAFLVSVVDREGHEELLYYGRQALFLMVLVLCKNTGFIWAAFGLLFDYGYHVLLHRKTADGKGQGIEAQECSGLQRGMKSKGMWKPLFLVTLFPVLTESSWLIFCLLNRRVAKLTGTAIQMATGGMNIPAYQSEMVKAFLQAFTIWPLHRGKTFAIDLSPLGLYLILILLVVLLYRLHLLEKAQARYIGVFLAVTGIVFYAFNLISHLTIFAVETQYLEPFGMVSSIERYGAPFTIGGLYLLAYFAMQGKKPLAGAAVCMGFVLLTTDYGSAYRALIGHQERVPEILAEREAIVDQAAEAFLQAVGAGEDTGLGRVLYLRDISDVSWVRNTYISFEAPPVSVMYGNIDTASVGGGDIAAAVRDAHAQYLYVDPLAGNGEELFAPFLQEKFEYGCLYRVMYAGGLHFEKVTE